MMGCALSVQKKEDFNRWQSLFTEPCEILYIIMDDWTTFPFSNQDENQVLLILGTLEKELRTPERDYKIKDIAVIIHNHFKSRKFSLADKKLYWRLKRKKYGFKGLFLLYSHINNKVYDIEKGGD